MAESKLAGPIKLWKQKLDSYKVSCIVFVCSYAKPWPYSDIDSSCRQSIHVFTSSYVSI